MVAVSPNGGEHKPDISIELSVSTGFVDATIKMPLPKISTKVDLQFYFNGEQQTALTQRYTNLLPKDRETLEFTASLALDSYKVTVMISEAGKNNFVPYATYQVNGKTGEVKQTELIPFVETQPSTAPSSDVSIPEDDTTSDVSTVD